MADYDVWGGSWGNSWGLSWTGEPPPSPSPTPPPGGDSTKIGYAEEWRRRDKIRFLQKRKRIPRKAAKIIFDVAQRQVDDLQQDEQKRFDELSRSLEAAQVKWRAEYLEMLNAVRDELITAELRNRLQVIQEQALRIEDEFLVMMLIASSV